MDPFAAKSGGEGIEKAKAAAEAAINSPRKTVAKDQRGNSEGIGPPLLHRPSTSTGTGSFNWNSVVFGRASSTNVPLKKTKRSLVSPKSEPGDKAVDNSILGQHLPSQNTEYDVKFKAFEKAKTEEIEKLHIQLQEQEDAISQLKTAIERGKENLEHHTRILKRDILKAKEEKAFEIEHLKTELRKAAENSSLSNSRFQSALVHLRATENKLDAIMSDQAVREKEAAAANQATFKANEKLTAENKSLTEYTIELKTKLCDLHNDYDQYVEQSSSALQAEVDKRCLPLQNETAKLRHALRNLEEECRRRASEDQRQDREFSSSKIKAAEKIAVISKDNEELRAYIGRISSNSKQMEPVFSDDHYVLAFKQLNDMIELWIVKHWKKNTRQNWHPTSHERNLQGIADFGPTGREAAESLRSQLLPLYANKPSPVRIRIPLIRHIFAAFLFDQILEPFAIGLDSQVSHTLSIIEDDLFSQGHNYDKILMIRQAIGRGALKAGNQKADSHPSHKKDSLAPIFCRVFPELPPKDLADALTNFVDKAIALKSEMTEEQAIIRCFMVHRGQSVAEDLVTTGELDEATTGKVLMCTFPGLEKVYVDEDGKVNRRIMVRACGEPIGIQDSVKANVAPDA